MPPELSELDFTAFQALVYEAAGIRLASNKRELLVTRLARRLQALGLTSYRAYYKVLTSGDPLHEEREHFINCITTNKTNFFREPHHFDFVRDELIPRLRARVAQGAPRRLRIWSAACSTGEEPYSLAMVAHRELARDGYAIQIVASDIDTEVLARAHDGVYSGAQLAEVPPELRARYFERAGEQWRARDELRALLELHQVNLIHDNYPFQGPFDAIFLRNVIIYFDRPSQVTLFQRLQRYLEPTSYLFLGHSESLLHTSNAFEPAGRTIYQLRRSRRRSTVGKRRGRATIQRLDTGAMVVSQDALRIDLVVGPSVAVCMFEPKAKLGGVAELPGGTSSEAAQAIDQLVGQLIERGAARPELRAKLVGGGAATSSDRELGARTIELAEAALLRAAIPLASRRVGGNDRLEIQFFTGSGRLLCRAHELAGQRG